MLDLQQSVENTTRNIALVSSIVNDLSNTRLQLSNTPQDMQLTLIIESASIILSRLCRQREALMKSQNTDSEALQQEKEAYKAMLEQMQQEKEDIRAKLERSETSLADVKDDLDIANDNLMKQAVFTDRLQTRFDQLIERAQAEGVDGSVLTQFRSSNY